MLASDGEVAVWGEEPLSEDIPSAQSSAFEQQSMSSSVVRVDDAVICDNPRCKYVLLTRVPNFVASAERKKVAKAHASVAQLLAYSVPN